MNTKSNIEKKKDPIATDAAGNLSACAIKGKRSTEFFPRQCPKLKQIDTYMCRQMKQQLEECLEFSFF